MSSPYPIEPPPPAPSEDDLQEPAAPHEIPPRIPNFGHALAFLAIAAFLLIAFQTLLFAFTGFHLHAPTTIKPAGLPSTKLLVASEALTYLCTLGAAAFLFSRLWNRPFLSGIQWNSHAVRHQPLRLIGLGISLGFTVQIVTYFITSPKSLPIDDFFLTPADAWLMTLFGTLVAPAFEEIAFRGFLLPAISIAYDWLSLPRTPEAHARWQSTTTVTPISLLFSAVATSIFFALLHAQQIGRLIPALLVLFTVSLVLTYVRIRTRSVACSTLVHASYNGFVFLMLLIQTGGYRHLDKLTR